jgi:hypothetical protein
MNTCFFPERSGMKMHKSQLLSFLKKMLQGISPVLPRSPQLSPDFKSQSALVVTMRVLSGEKLAQRM